MNHQVVANAFTKEEIERIHSLSHSFNSVQGYIMKNGENNDRNVDSDYRSSRVSWILLNKNTSWIYDKVLKIATELNSKVWMYDILSIEKLQYSVYESEENGHYDWHIDSTCIGLASNASTQPEWRKLSISVQLSDPSEYDGGELEFLVSRSATQAPKDLGAMIAFPSFLLHRVNPVTRGKRVSLVAWISGPRLK